MSGDGIHTTKHSLQKLQITRHDIGYILIRRHAVKVEGAQQRYNEAAPAQQYKIEAKYKDQLQAVFGLMMNPRACVGVVMVYG